MPPSNNYKEILKELNRAIREFNKNVPSTQREMLKEIEHELRRLDLDGDNIKVTVKNLTVINSIRNKMNRIVITDKYKADVKAFLESFIVVADLQHEYWRSIESKFKPTPLLKQIKQQAMLETAGALTEAGISVNVSGRIVDILRANITTGGSYAKLTEQLRQGIVDTKTPGFLNRYATQITTDAINQYAANYNQIVSSDLGYEWYVYDNTDILTTRCFCDAMTDQPYFHLSEIPRLLTGKGLKCEGEPVPINDKTNLPYGMYPDTNADNFLIRRGGYNCRHQCRPMNERFIPLDVRERVYATPAYKNWRTLHGLSATKVTA